MDREASVAAKNPYLGSYEGGDADLTARFVLQVGQAPGSLKTRLDLLAKVGLSIINIESQPASTLGRYNIFVDVETKSQVCFLSFFFFSFFFFPLICVL